MHHDVTCPSRAFRRRRRHLLEGATPSWRPSPLASEAAAPSCVAQAAAPSRPLSCAALEAAAPPCATLEAATPSRPPGHRHPLLVPPARRDLGPQLPLALAARKKREKEIRDERRERGMGRRPSFFEPGLMTCPLPSVNTLGKEILCRVFYLTLGKKISII